MAAKVRPGDRENSGFPDGSYPCKSHAERMSAIKLRGHSKAHSAASVLAHVATWARKAKDSVALAAIAKARDEDHGGK
jgi:hypothetical protein